MDFNLFNGDCLDVLKTLPDNSVDSIVTDPPYGLSNQSQDDIVKCLTAWLADEAYTHGSSGFMGKKWDSFVPSPIVWKECLRVLKHGGYIACFAGSRTQDLMGISLRLAGFELRDIIFWCFGSGFPKGLDIAKGIDKEMGFNESDRPVVCKNPAYSPMNGIKSVGATGWETPMRPQFKTGNVSDQAKQWEGWNTNLKPAYEPIILARKPLDGTVVNNVLKHGVGGLNIGACRVGSEGARTNSTGKREIYGGNSLNKSKSKVEETTIYNKGRYPANLIHDGSEEATGGMPWTKSGSGQKNQYKESATPCGFMAGAKPTGKEWDGSEGSASRYFYCAKASKADRDEGLEGFELRQGGAMGGGKETRENRPTNHPMRSNIHPTIKPTALMQYVTKLITPLNGTVLDPFMGSGSTGKACMLEGFNFTGIELSSEYLAIAEARIKHAQKNAV